MGSPVTRFLLTPGGLPHSPYHLFDAEGQSGQQILGGQPVIELIPGELMPEQLHHLVHKTVWLLGREVFKIHFFAQGDGLSHHAGRDKAGGVGFLLQCTLHLFHLGFLKGSHRLI